MMNKPRLRIEIIILLLVLFIYAIYIFFGFVTRPDNELNQEIQNKVYQAFINKDINTIDEVFVNGNFYYDDKVYQYNDGVRDNILAFYEDGDKYLDIEKIRFSASNMEDTLPLHFLVWNCNKIENIDGELWWEVEYRDDKLYSLKSDSKDLLFKYLFIDNDTKNEFIKIESKEKELDGEIISFKDKAFEFYIREYYGLESADIKRKDVKFRKDLILGDFEEYEENKYPKIKLKGDIKTLEDLKYFENLEYLELHSIGGDLSDIAVLSKLKKLVLDFTEISGDIEEISQLESLKVLELEYCKNITGDISSLNKLSQLKILEIDNVDKLTGDFKNLNKLDNLESLSIYSDVHPIDNPNFLKLKLDDLVYLKKLKKLYLGGYHVSGNIDSLTKLENLETLDLCKCGELSGTLDSFSNLKKLKKILFYGIAGDFIDTKDLAKIESLEELFITRTKLNGRIGDLASLKNFKFLTIDGSHISVDTDELGTLRSLEKMAFHHIEINGDIAGIVGAKNLKILRIIECSGNVNGDIGELGKLTKIEEISFFKLNCSGNIKGLANLTNLRRLSLAFCENISGDIGALNKLKQLKDLDIEGTLITASLEI